MKNEFYLVNNITAFFADIRIVLPFNAHSKKTTMKRHLSPSLVLFVLFVASLFFQNGKVHAQIANWDVHALTGGASNYGPSPLSPTFTASNVTVGGLTRGSGVTQSGTAAARGWGGTGWSIVDTTNAISNNQFFTFTVVANSGYTISLTAIDTFDYRRSATGPAYALVQYQINSGSFVSIGVDTFSSTSSSGASIGSKDLSSISALQNIPSTSVITFRFVPFGATAAGGTFYIFSKANNTLSDFSLKGTVAVATSNTITTGAVTTTPFALANCSATASGSVAFTSVGTFTSGNVYTAQLSNASGSFASPVNIGTLSSTASGSQSISITIPAGTPTGSGYLIQVISSNPGVTGTASSAFTINQSGVCSTASTDYFRSVTDGNWNSTSTWQSSPDNTTWISATAVPDSAANTITIRNGDTVTVSASVTAADQLVVATGGTLSISAGKTITITNGAGTDLDVFGTVTNAGAMVTTGASVIFEANSFYNHTAAVASLIPAATWNSSSTCTVSGMTTSGTAPTAAGLKQTFGNFVWNCSGQTAFININDTLFGTTGTLSMQASGASSGLGLNSTPGTTRVYNFGAITVSGGILELSFLGATGTVGQTVANVSGDVNVNGTGYLALAVEGTSITTSLNQGIYASILTIGGNLNVNTSSGAKFANAGSHYSMIIFTKNGTQNYTNSAVVSSTDNYGVDYAITPNSTLALQSRLSLDGTYLGQLSVSGTINLGTQIVSDSTTNISATSQIPADFILSGNTTASVSATMVKDSNFIVVSSTNGFTKGMSITGTNIPTNTFVADTVSGSKIVLTKKAIGSGTNIVTGTATCKVITANAGGLMYTAASGSVSQYRRL